MSKSVLVIGTGTIGEPLIGLMADLRKKLGIDNVYFHKRTPLVDEIAKVNSMISKGAKLVVDPDKVISFQQLGHNPVLVYQEALELCDEAFVLPSINTGRVQDSHIKAGHALMEYVE